MSERAPLVERAAHAVASAADDICSPLNPSGFARGGFEVVEEEEEGIAHIFCVGRKYAAAAGRASAAKIASLPPPSVSPLSVSPSSAPPAVAYNHHSFVSSVINITDERERAGVCVGVSCITRAIIAPSRRRAGRRDTNMEKLRLWRASHHRSGEM